VQIGVEHYDREGNEKYSVLVLKGALLKITSIIFPVALAEGGNYSIDFLSFPW
jgi:hypothetical protein